MSSSYDDIAKARKELEREGWKPPKRPGVDPSRLRRWRNLKDFLERRKPQKP